MAIRIPFDPVKLAELCRKHRIRTLSLFGSALRDDFSPTSDVDLLVDFYPDQRLGLRFFDVQDELSELFGGRRIDLVKEKQLSDRLKPFVLPTAEVLYAEG